MYVELGKIVGVWGVKGWVKLHSYTRQRIDIAGYKNWWLSSKNRSSELDVENLKQVAILNCREQGQGVVAQIEGVDNRDQAAALSGQIIFVKKTELPNLPDGEYYWQELIGLVVSNIENIELGEITSILETGANDVLVIKNKVSGAVDILVPNIPEVVKNIDLKLETMLVDWDPSFLLD